MTIERAQEISKALSLAAGADVGDIRPLRGPDSTMAVKLPFNPAQALVAGKLVASEAEANDWLNFTFASTEAAVEAGYIPDWQAALWTMFGAGFTLGLAASKKEGTA